MVRENRGKKRRMGRNKEVSSVEVGKSKERKKNVEKDEEGIKIRGEERIKE